MALKNRLEDLVMIIENVRSEGLKEVKAIKKDIEQGHTPNICENDIYRDAARIHMTDYDIELENLVIDIMKGEWS